MPLSRDNERSTKRASSFSRKVDIFLPYRLNISVVNGLSFVRKRHVFSVQLNKAKT